MTANIGDKSATRSPSETETTGARLLVPVSESVTLRNTVAYAVREALERAEAAGVDPVVHFIYPLSERVTPGDETAGVRAARDLLDRVAVWTQEDLGEDADAVTVETAHVGSDDYLFSPGDYAAVFDRYARANDLQGVVLDPGYNPAGTTPLLPPLRAEVDRAGLPVEEAPVERARRDSGLVRTGGVGQFLALFGISYLFYLVLAWSTEPFELATGAISGLVVAVALSRVSLTDSVRPRQTAARVARSVLYVPYLLYEITKSNLQIAYIVLHPDLPIDPQVEEFEAAVWTPASVATLANSITLTPGTLTIDVSRRYFTVHALTEGSRRSLLEGGLERAVRFVFYGRAAARIPSPRERRQTETGGEES